jgi:antitoxin (DNA-binding transcriptional repressor) of toxin-antitoxin stability system
MKTVMNVAEAKAKLSELIERAERGEEVLIARKGKVVVHMKAINPMAAAKPDRANLFGALAHLGPVPEAALEPEPLDAWYSEQPIESFAPPALKVAEHGKPFDHES